MLAPDQAAVSDKEPLYNRILLVFCQGDHVFVFSVAVRDLLLLRHSQYAVSQIPVTDRLLKLHLLGGFFHLLLQFLQNAMIIPVQKIHCFFHILRIFFLADITHTRCITLLHVIIQTRPVLHGFFFYI